MPADALRSLVIVADSLTDGTGVSLKQRADTLNPRIEIIGERIAQDWLHPVVARNEDETSLASEIENVDVFDTEEP